MSVKSERIRFPGADGAALDARLDSPAEEPRAYALFAHCFTCSKDIFAAARISRALAERGIGVLRFDFTGLGSSEGEFANTNFSSNVADLVAAAGFMADSGRAPKILVGHSLGGAAVLAAAHRVPSAAAVATVAAPYDPAHVGRLFAHAEEQIRKEGEAEVELAGRRFRIRRQFLDDIAEQHLKPLIAGLDKALLVFHSPQDATVGIDNARLIFEAARHPKSFVSLDDADHLLSRREDATYAAEVLAAWASRYIGAAEAVGHDTAPGRAEPGEVLVAEAGDGGFAQLINAGGHLLRADEPVSVGGSDTGPSPYDLLLAGLGACTAMTIRLYAGRKNWPLERVAVRLRHRKVHAEDCADCEDKDARIDEIERALEITGNLDRAQRDKLVEIAGKCPVHRTLEGEKRILTRLVE